MLPRKPLNLIVSAWIDLTIWDQHLGRNVAPNSPPTGQTFKVQKGLLCSAESSAHGTKLYNKKSAWSTCCRILMDSDFKAEVLSLSSENVNMIGYAHVCQGSLPLFEMTGCDQFDHWTCQTTDAFQIIGNMAPSVNPWFRTRMNAHVIVVVSLLMRSGGFAPFRLFTSQLCLFLSSISTFWWLLSCFKRIQIGWIMINHDGPTSQSSWHIMTPIQISQVVSVLKNGASGKYRTSNRFIMAHLWRHQAAG